MKFKNSKKFQIKNLKHFFIKIRKDILKFTRQWKGQVITIALDRKNTVEGFQIHTVKIHYKVTMINNMKIDQEIPIDS